MKKHRNLTNLLFISDDQEILNLLVSLFKDDKYREFKVFTATDTDEAKKIVFKEKIHLVFEDWNEENEKFMSNGFFKEKPDVIKILIFDCQSVQGQIKQDGVLYVNANRVPMFLKELVAESLKRQQKQKEVIMSGKVKYFVIFTFDRAVQYHLGIFRKKFNNDFLQIKEAMNKRFRMNIFLEFKKQEIKSIKEKQPDSGFFKVTNGEISEL